MVNHGAYGFVAAKMAVQTVKETPVCEGMMLPEVSNFCDGAVLSLLADGDR